LTGQNKLAFVPFIQSSVEIDDKSITLEKNGSGSFSPGPTQLPIAGI
jgi:hypothetical protein